MKIDIPTNEELLAALGKEAELPILGQKGTITGICLYLGGTPMLRVEGVNN